MEALRTCQRRGNTVSNITKKNRVVSAWHVHEGLQPNVLAHFPKGFNPKIAQEVQQDGIAEIWDHCEMYYVPAAELDL